MAVKRKELIELWGLIEQHRKIKNSVKFSYWLAKNRKRIQPEVEALEEAIEPSKSYREYDTERARVAKFYADKDETGKPIIQNASYVVIKQLDEFNNELNLLKERYKDDIEKREKQIEEYNRLLEEDVEEFDGFKISLEDLPDGIEPIFIESLMGIGLLIEPDEK